MVLIIVITLAPAIRLQGQGVFRNLEFEETEVPPDTPNDTRIPAAEALPGWIVDGTTGGVPLVVYNGVTLGSSAVWLVSQSDPRTKEIEGDYSIVMVGDAGDLTISQRAVIPLPKSRVNPYPGSFVLNRPLQIEWVLAKDLRTTADASTCSAQGHLK